MSTAPLHRMSATAIARALRSRAISSVEATRHFIDRIESRDGAINAVPVRDFERALDAARRADATLAAGGDALPPLLGVPMTVKEAFFVEGLATTYGIEARRTHVAQADSQLIARVRASGAVLLGKTNVPLMCADWQSYNTVYGTTHNPWRIGRSPGGSSGGSAAALAAGLSPLELGSDRAGSIRVPAAFCGVLGHKPTWGILPGLGDSLHGDVSPSDIAAPGPMAMHTEDLVLFLRVLLQEDAASRPWRQVHLPQARWTSLRGLRIAIWTSDATVRTSTAITQRLAALQQELARCGAQVRAFEPFFDTRQAYEHARLLRVASAITGKSRGMLDTYRSALASGEPMGPMRERIARAAVASHYEWAQANEWRNRLRRQWDDFFHDTDVLICPATLDEAFPIDETGSVETRQLVVDGVACDYYDQEFWPILFGACHLPVTTLPLGLSANGLPLGAQVVGAEGRDFDTIRAVELVQRALGLQAQHAPE